MDYWFEPTWQPIECSLCANAGATRVAADAEIHSTQIWTVKTNCLNNDVMNNLTGVQCRHMAVWMNQTQVVMMYVSYTWHCCGIRGSQGKVRIQQLRPSCENSLNLLHWYTLEKSTLWSMTNWFHEHRWLFVCGKSACGLSIMA